MSISIDPTMASMINTGSVYNNAELTAANKLSSQIESASTDEDTLQACKDFEAYMLEQIFKKMNDSAKLLADDDDEDSTSSQYVEMFEDTYYQDIAKKMMSSGQSIGIAEQLYESITNQKLGISRDTTTPAQAAAEAAQAALEQNTDSGTQALASLLGIDAEDVETMTAEQKAEAASLATQSSFADALLGGSSD